MSEATKIHQPYFLFRRGSGEGSAGEAHVGGLWRPPPYASAYVTCAGWTLDRALQDGMLSEMAMPIFYLQRHSLELILKDVRDAVDYVEHSTECLRRGVSIEPRRPAQIHGLGELATVVSAGLQRLELETPGDLLRLAAEIAAAEDGDETRTRYRTGKRREPTYARSSFPVSTSIPLAAWQARLVALYRQVGARHPRLRVGDATLLEVLGDEAASLFQALCTHGLE